VGVQLIWINDVAHAQNLELLHAAAASRIDGEQHGPNDEAAGEADVAEDLDEAQKEEAVEGAVVEDVGVGCLKERLDPIEPAIGKVGCRISMFRLLDIATCNEPGKDNVDSLGDALGSSQRGDASRRIDAATATAQDEENGETDGDIYHDGNEGCAKLGDGRALAARRGAQRAAIAVFGA
jgi:hypothetical protein